MEDVEIGKNSGRLDYLYVSLCISFHSSTIFESDDSLHNCAFQLFAKHHTTLGQSPFTRPSAINIELPLHQSDRSCGWLTVPYSTSVNATREHTVRWEDQSIFPGDIIVGDSDGVVAVPHHWLQRVLEGCRKGKEVERLCREDLMAGRGVGETFKERRGK